NQLALYVDQVLYCLMKTRLCEPVFGSYEDIRRLTRHCETDNRTVTPSVRHCGFNNDRIRDLSRHCSSHNDPAAVLFERPNKKTGHISCARLNLNQTILSILVFLGVQQ